MRILKAVDGSVLWLIQDNASAEKNLKAEAIKRDASSDRIVFVERLPLPEHLARHRVAIFFWIRFHTTPTLQQVMPFGRGYQCSL